MLCSTVVARAIDVSHTRSFSLRNGSFQEISDLPAVYIRVPESGLFSYLPVKLLPVPGTHFRGRGLDCCANRADDLYALFPL